MLTPNHRLHWWGKTLFKPNFHVSALATLWKVSYLYALNYLTLRLFFYLTFFFSTEKIGDDWVITDLLFSESSLHLSGIKFPTYRLTHKRLVVTVTLFVRIPASHTQCTFNQCITWFGQRLCLKEYYPLQSQ